MNGQVSKGPLPAHSLSAVAGQILVDCHMLELWHDASSGPPVEGNWQIQVNKSLCGPSHAVWLDLTSGERWCHQTVRTDESVFLLPTGTTESTWVWGITVRVQDCKNSAFTWGKDLSTVRVPQTVSVLEYLGVQHLGGITFITVKDLNTSSSTDCKRQRGQRDVDTVWRENIWTFI